MPVHHARGCWRHSTLSEWKQDGIHFNQRKLSCVGMRSTGKQHTAVRLACFPASPGSRFLDRKPSRMPALAGASSPVPTLALDLGIASVQLELLGQGYKASIMRCCHRSLRIFAKLRFTISGTTQMRCNLVLGTAGCDPSLYIPLSRLRSLAMIERTVGTLAPKADIFRQPEQPGESLSPQVVQSSISFSCRPTKLHWRAGCDVKECDDGRSETCCSSSIGISKRRMKFCT